MHPIALLIIALGNIILGIIAFFYFKRFQQSSSKHTIEIEKNDRELKRKVLELQVLRSLSERAGYSLDLKQILEVITDSLEGIVEFSTISYMLLGPEGKVILDMHLAKPVSEAFVNDIKGKIISAFSVMVGHDLPVGQINETISGSVPDTDINNSSVGSFFNLPLVIGKQPVALINVASPQIGLYGDEETSFLYAILTQVSVSASKLSQVVENEKSRLSAMISSLLDGIAMIDPESNLIVDNPALYQILKIEGQANLYKIMASVGTKIDLDKMLKQAFQTQKVVKTQSFEVNGLSVEVNIEPVKDKFGYLLGLAIVFRDITAQKALERLREEFTAMMVHELRTPLTTINYGVDNIMTNLLKVSKEELSDTLNIVLNTTKNMLGLVSELLDMAKIEAGKFTVVKKEGDLGKVLKEKVTAFKPLVEQKKVALVSEIGSGLDKVNFDPIRLGQVINNLLSNSIKYTDLGKIIIKAEVVGNQAQISIADSGAGIAKEDLPKLFSKFEQLGKGKTGEKDGTGLGLVVTKGIIEAHGGKIWVESEGIGKGTTFSFSIPLK
ncbi:MAG: ATP-binding protein [Candidatus Daviesbacteria bacterium]|nr:ATP-binding protein [Candidatus Daviesbacteria bacterium]